VTHAAPEHLRSTETDVEAVPRRETALARVQALQTAAGNRAFGRLVRAAVQRSPLDDWTAARVAAGELGKSAKGNSIEIHHFPGSKERRALVIGGVHGTERQGVEVTRLLQKDLATAPADFSVILVPVLFPDNAAAGSVGIREGATPTNRNFPGADKDLASSGGTDAQGRAILSENQLLMSLMEHYRPERIISLHGPRLAPAVATSRRSSAELRSAERRWLASTRRATP
jgi:hypothetical protein